MNKIIVFSICGFYSAFNSTSSHAVIQLRETGRSVTVFNTPNQTQRAISTSAGEAGDFELLMCATRSDGSNFFSRRYPWVDHARQRGMRRERRMHSRNIYEDR